MGIYQHSTQDIERQNNISALCTKPRISNYIDHKERGDYMILLPHKIDSSWEAFLTEDMMNELHNIEQEIGTNFNPTDPEMILRFLTVPLDQVKVVWLGQDVYPAKGVATGRAFEIGQLDSWQAPFRQASLRNIVRLIHKNYTNIENYESIYTFQAIREEIKSGTFPIKEPPVWFESLEKQGVLFLNSAFTCEVDVPNSHKHLWRRFSEHVFQYISEQRPDIIWFLWGKEAIAKKAFIPEGTFMESRHPSRCSASYEDDFLKFTGFKDTKHLINWLG